MENANLVFSFYGACIMMDGYLNVCFFRFVLYAISLGGRCEESYVGSDDDI
jgi:hypothetical protein